MQLRNATLADVAGIQLIMNDAVLNTTAIYDYYERNEEYVKKWMEDKQRAGMPVIVAADESGILGYGTYGIFRPRDGYRFCVEHSIYVRADTRGKGTGAALMQYLVGLARGQGYHTMVGGIDAANEASYNFHLKFGFKEVGRMPEVGFKFNRWLDLVFMQLML